MDHRGAPRDRNEPLYYVPTNNTRHRGYGSNVYDVALDTGISR